MTWLLPNRLLQATSCDVVYMVANLKVLAFALFALFVSGCGETIYVSKLTPTTVSPEAEDALVFPRQCDANRASPDP